MKDLLAAFSGLADQPMPGTPECDRLEQALMFAIDDAGSTRESCGRAVLRFMVARGYWPLGTRVEVSEDFQVKTTFPE